ncbi:hypothetical protein HELRODRAFT_101399 [Helobdella robusta]|uniref:DUF4461 domain-containing protein n=1 Tax=Helobdella robusta TaxID=6412 RepID=T1ED44_HELRO|nr:hypothetical protein HELRODRAFT_101399 [Helobdella robusta]ESN99737.1 hypothetical protein HELRODRAFT_101399 [Helobdella robusta]
MLLAKIFKHSISLRLSNYRLTTILFFAPSRRSKSLSVSETSIALRPFIFRVHPDLFSKYGIEKAKINEESLKLLNEYIHKLHNNEQVRPLKLLFYLRKLPSSTNNESNALELRTVNISLQSTNVTDTISNILNTCHLPLDYLESIGVSRHSFHVGSSSCNKSTTLEWTSDKELWRVFQQMECEMFNPRFQQYDSATSVHTRHHNENSVSSWLKRNLKKARENMKKVQPMRDEVTRLQEIMVRDFGLAEIKWQSGWTVSTHSAALKSLCRIICGGSGGGGSGVSGSGEYNVIGKTVVFGNDLGISVEGHIILRQDTVSDAWKYILKNQSHYDSTLRAIPHFEKTLSTLLNGIQVLPPQQSVVLAVSYLQQLKALIDCIHAYRKESLDDIKEDVHDLQLTVECATGPILMAEQGQIMVPTSCPAFLIFDYIKKNSHKARSMQKEFQRCQLSDESTISLCQSMLGLQALLRDSSITRQQMVTCCRRLIRLVDTRALKLDLSSIWLRIGQFYTVTVEGEMCIPWNFEDVI